MHMGVDAVMMCIVERLTVLLKTPVAAIGGGQSMLERGRMIFQRGSHHPSATSEDDGDHQENEKAG